MGTPITMGDSWTSPAPHRTGHVAGFPCTLEEKTRSAAAGPSLQMELAPAVFSSVTPTCRPEESASSSQGSYGRRGSRPGIRSIARTTDFETVLIDGFPVSATLQAARVEVGPAGTSVATSRTFSRRSQNQSRATYSLTTFRARLPRSTTSGDRGLVIISSCGHSGIVNTVRHVQAVTGIDKVHAVVGGIHLAAAPDALVTKTADAFQQIQPDYFVPMHCTGL